MKNKIVSLLQYCSQSFDNSLFVIFKVKIARYCLSAGLMEHTDFEHVNYLEKNIKDCDKESLNSMKSNKGFIGQKLLHICNNLLYSHVP